MKQLVTLYYAATVLFMLLDYGFGANVRVAFLDGYAGARAGYYAVCLFCLFLTLWRPRWGPYVGAFESLLTLVALTFAMALRVMVPTAAMFDGSQEPVTMEVVLNYIISGTFAYFIWYRRMNALKSR